MSIFNAIKGATNILKSGVVQKGAKVLFKIKKYGPAIAVVGGSVGTVVAGAIAVKKSIDDAPEALDEIRTDIAMVKNNDLGPAALTRVYAHSALKLGKVYALPIAIEAGSVFAILYGYKVINGRFVAMTATAAASEEMLRRVKENHAGYREALAERYGADFDKDLRYTGCDFDAIGGPGKAPIYTETDENGNEVTKEGAWTIKDVISTDISPYAVIFDETSTEWSKDPEYNRMTLHRIQMTCNDMLHANGHLFLNQVYRELGLPDTRAGQMVGWIDGEGDSYVDFGIYDLAAVDNRREFINGYEPSILLDFNVDGMIWDRI